jgi:hypothetical protein
MTSTTSTTASPQMSRSRHRWWLAGGVAVLLLAAAAAVWMLGGMHHHNHGNGNGNGNEHAMAQRAAQVMPFDLNATTHTFTKTGTGGVEKVVANRSTDQRNISLIRQHLSMEAGKFAQGDYSDPATIHGTGMPGLQELRAAGTRVRIDYAEVPAGATITYSATDPVLVAALHSWFDAQSSQHAMPGMGG